MRATKRRKAGGWGAQGETAAGVQTGPLVPRRGTHDACFGLHGHDEDDNVGLEATVLDGQSVPAVALSSRRPLRELLVNFFSLDSTDCSRHLAFVVLGRYVLGVACRSLCWFSSAARDHSRRRQLPPPGPLRRSLAPGCHPAARLIKGASCWGQTNLEQDEPSERRHAANETCKAKGA